MYSFYYKIAVVQHYIHVMTGQIVHINLHQFNTDQKNIVLLEKSFNKAMDYFHTHSSGIYVTQTI